MLWVGCLRNLGLIPGWGQQFFFLQSTQTNSVVHPASNQWITGNFTGKKMDGGMNDNSIPFSAEFKNKWNYIFNPPTPYSMNRDLPLPKTT